MIFGSTVILSILLASPLAGARLVLHSDLPQPQSSEQPPGAPKPCATSATTSPKPSDCSPTRRKKTKQQSATHVSSSGTNSTKVIRNGGTSEPIVAISPAESQQQAIQEISTTTQLLADADANLRELSRRQLSEDDEGTVKQIQVYMLQARAAVKNGEAQRAYILANKADMLSADLVRPRR